MATTVSIADVEELVKRLYTPGEPVVLIQQQLQQLQKSDQGWQLADALLNSQDANVRFFGALTFTVKLNGVLDEPTALQVLSRLKYWLVRLVEDTSIVVRKLTATLVTYYIRTPVRWQRPHQDLSAAFGGNLTTPQIKALLSFSTNLADEMGKMEHAPHAILHKQMEEELDDAVQLMSAGLSIANIETLHCFAMWTNYGQPLWASKDALHCLRQLTIPMMDCLLDDEAQDDARVVFTDLLESYTSFFLSDHLDRCAELLQIAFIPITDLQACQLVVAYGIAIIDDVVERPHTARAQVVLPPVGNVLQEPGVPGEDDDLTPICIEFWNTYVEYVSDTSTGYEEWLPNAKAVMTEASQLLWRKLLIPTALDNTDDFKTFRSDAADLLSSMYITLGKDMLVQFVSLILQSLDDWQAVEAGIFCLNALADNALEYEENDQYLAPLFRPLFAGDYNNQTRRTIIDMISEYGALLKRHPEHIPDAVRYLFSSLDTPVANVAAKSIYELCSTCRTKLTGDLNVFISQYQTLQDPFVKEKVVGGIAAIIQALPDEEKVQPLLTLIESVKGQGTVTLQCLASMGKASQEPEDIDAEENTFWKGPGKIVQDQIISCFTLDGTGEAIDTACQVLKTGYTEVSGPFVFPPAFTVDFLRQCTVETSQVESVLSATALLITQCSRSRGQRIDEEAPQILDHVTSFIEALTHPGQDPSVSSNCLEIVSRLLRAYYKIVLDYSKLSLILNFALAAIESHDITPKRSALDMFAKLVKAESSTDVINTFGPLLVQTLIRQIAGLGQRSDLDSVNEPLKELYQTYPLQAKQWTEAALTSQAFPSVRGKVGEAEKRRFLAQLIGVRGGAKVKEITRDFYALCRGVVASYS